MGNIKKFLKYFLPLIVLPMLASYLNIISTISVNALGSTAIAAKSSVSSLTSMYSGVLNITAIAALAISALLAEKGKAKAAKIVHLICLLSYAASLTLIAVIYLFMPQVFMYSIGVPSEVFGMSIAYAGAFILPVLIFALIAALISQLTGKHSFILIMVLGAGIIVCSLFVGMILMRAFGFGITGVAIADGMSFAAASVMPFLMVPVKRYSKTFAPATEE